MNIIALIIQLLSGAAGGNLAGKLIKKIDLGTLGNSIAGILGGGLGGSFSICWVLPVAKGARWT